MPASPLKNAWSALRTRFFAQQERIDKVHELYAAIVQQARQAVFYKEWGVPDSLDGRFDLIVLHLHLVAREFSSPEPAEKNLHQALLGLFFSDMDRSLREMGVGDLSVGKKIRNMAEAYYGRANAYEEALSSEDEQKLHEAIGRNLYGGDDSSAEKWPLVARYVRAVGAEMNTWNKAPAEIEACFARALHQVSAHATS